MYNSNLYALSDTGPVRARIEDCALHKTPHVKGIVHEGIVPTTSYESINCIKTNHFCFQVDAMRMNNLL